MDKLKDILIIDGVDARGYGKIPKIVMHDPRLTIEAKAIYAYFCSYAGSGISAFPSVSLILDHLKISRKRYYNHLASLRECGYVSVKQNRTKAGLYTNTIYTLVQKPVSDDSLGKETPCSRIDPTEAPCSRYPTTDNDTTINNSINNKFNNINQSICLSTNKEIRSDRLAELDCYYSIENHFKSLIGYDELLVVYSDDGLVDDILLNILEMYYSTSTRVGGKDLSQSLVRGVLNKLDHFKVLEVIDKFHQQGENIINPKGYIQAMLYNQALESNLVNRGSIYSKKS